MVQESEVEETVMLVPAIMNWPPRSAAPRLLLTTEAELTEVEVIKPPDKATPPMLP